MKKKALSGVKAETRVDELEVEVEAMATDLESERRIVGEKNGEIEELEA